MGIITNDKRYLIVLLSIILIAFTSSQKAPQVISFHPEASLVKQLLNELSHVSSKDTLPSLKFPDLINFVDANNSTLNITQLQLGIAELNADEATVTCVDNSLKLLGGTEKPGEFFFLASYQVLINGTSFNGEVELIVNGNNLFLSKEFKYVENKPVVTASVHLDFALKSYVLDSNSTEFKDILESGVKSYIENTMTGIINKQLQQDLTNFYSLAYINNLVLKFDTYNPQRDFTFDVNYVETPVTRKDTASQKCAIAFKRSGAVSSIDMKRPAANFSTFDFNNTQTQIFMNRYIFEDLITTISSKFALKGGLNEKKATFMSLPLDMTVGQFSGILPSISDSFGDSSEIEVHWAIYDIKLTFSAEKQKITGTARLDSTFFYNIEKADVKQVYSFDATLNFNLNLLTEKNKINYKLTNLEVSKIKVRENYGFTYINVLKNYLKVTFERALTVYPYTLFENDLDISGFFDGKVRSRILDDGILLF